MSQAFLVIMAGGSGTRFWPKSTSTRPKQLLSFQKDAPTLLNETLKRFEGLVPSENRIIVTTEKLRKAVEDDVPKEVTVLAEPQGRNTAPCTFWAAKEIAQKDPDGIMLMMPADHYIPNLPSFQKTIRGAIEWAEKGEDLVTLGVSPDRPETGYGYLRTGSTLQGNCKKVDAFVEKPNLEKAKEFLSAGNYLWNGGMFVWKVQTVLKAFDQFMPEMNQAWESNGGVVEKAYPKMTATSIDFGIMEKASNVVTFPLNCGWDDLGSWTSLENMADILQARQEGNVVTGGEALSVDSKGNIVDAPDRLVALLGVEDLIIVENGKALLVAQKEKAQDIKKVVEEVKKKRPELA